MKQFYQFLGMVLLCAGTATHAQQYSAKYYDENPHLLPQYEGQIEEEVNDLDSVEEGRPASLRASRLLVPGAQGPEEKKLPGMNLSRVSDRQLLEAIYRELYLQKNQALTIDR